jgi:amino acid adenylation domain-containing protein
MPGIDLQGYSLSPQQARLWEWQKKSLIYQTTCMIQIEGQLERWRFKKAIESIVKRHEILHTIFYSSPDTEIPLQVIDDDRVWSLVEVNLNFLDPDYQRRSLDDLFTTLQYDRDNLQHGPLLRIWLFRLTDKKQIIMIHLPALCADSQSMSILVDELARTYARETLPGEVLQYADVAAWQEDLLQSKATAPKRLYWQRMDLSQLFSLHLPFERKADDAGKDGDSYFLPHVQELSLSDDLTQQIKLICQNYDVSPSSFLLACWEILLWHLSEGTINIVGVAGNGRSYDELQHSLGLYTRFIPVSSYLEQERLFHVFLASVDYSLQKSLKQQLYFNWEDVSLPIGRVGRAGFLPLSFEHNVWPAAIGTDELTYSLVKLRSYIEPFLLNLSTLQVGDLLHVEIQYDRQYISHEQGHRIAEMLQALLLTIVAQPSAPIKALLAYTEGEPKNHPSLEATTRPEILPLSSAQQRLWFLEQLEPDSTAYLVAHAFQLQGAIQVRCLERTLEALIHRHESLRTTFVLHGEQPMQVVHPPTRFFLPVIDMQALKARQKQEQVRLLAQQEGGHSCDLVRGPLLRAALLRQGPDTSVFLLTLHHIITDGWSDQVLLRELRTLYQAFVNGQPSPLAPLTVQYADYALWQRQWLWGEVLEVQLAYWRRQLENISTLELPTDYPRPAVQMHRGASHSLMLSPALSQALVGLSQQEQVTLFMLLLAAFQVVLSYWTGQTDICVGTPIANRQQEQTRELIGFFANTLVLRTDLSGNPSFTHVLQRVREVCLKAYAHQDIPFEKLVEALAPQRNLSRSPLFQVMLVLQDMSFRETTLGGGSIRSISQEDDSNTFDLTLRVEETEEGLQGTVVYNAELFAAETMIRLLARWQMLLAGVVQAPETRLSELPRLSEEERRLLLVDWNATQVTIPQQGSLHKGFEQQVRRTPHAIALVSEEHLLSYEQLDQRANQLAHFLCAQGVGPEVLVGLAVERSFELVIGLLGILKAGGAFVPLDPDDPQERLTFLLQDARVCLLLTQEHLLAQFASASTAVVCLDRDWPQIAIHSVQTPGSHNDPAHLAYVIYTSGSTGKPKGTLNTHHAIYNRLWWMQDHFCLGASDRALQKTPSSFDFSVCECFWPLMNGAQLVLARPQGHRDTAYLLQLIQQQQISVIHFVPSLFQVFLEETGVEDCRTLRYVFCGGEALSSSLPERFYARQQALLTNMYGPTETAVDVSFWECQRTHHSSLVPIGFPIANTQLYILDQQCQLVPIGVAGELHIGGIQVGRGYLHRADLTAEKFIADPFSLEPGARLYRTGDRTRFRPDGAIEYLGRVDQQVKLRGYRIEVGEIEAALRTISAIREAVVILRGETLAEKQLVAYVVGQPGERLDHRELRSALQEQLPGYMVPSTFVVLSALPLMSNGKVDRQALPAPVEEQNPYMRQKARTPIEALLLDIWREVLGRHQIDLHDDFFELGGHSLLATQLLARIRGMLAAEVPLRALFEAPTVEAFALRVEQALRHQGGGMLPLLEAAERPAELPLSYGQQRLWFLEQWEPGNTAYLVSTAFHLEGAVQVRCLEQALQKLIDRHEILRTTFEVRGEQPVQIIHSQVHFHLPIIDLQALEAEQAQEQAYLLSKQEGGQPCDLAHGPLLRTALLRSGPSSQELLLTLHHIITDGWSNEVLFQELSLLYQASVNGHPSPLAPLAVQYADYALWQREWLQGEVLEQQLTYWHGQLDGAPVLELPTDFPRPLVQSSRGASLPVHLPLPMLEALGALSRQEQVTLFMLLLASFQVVLARWSGQSDISVGVPIANRRLEQTEGLIGFFVNTLVLRSDLSGNPSFRQLLLRVRQVCLQAYAHQDVPFEKLVDELAPQRDVSCTPLFQVLFALQNTPPRQVKLAEVSVQPLETKSSTSKFDLMLMLEETEEGLRGTLDYSTDLFTSETMKRLLEHWQTLLAGVLQASEAPLSDLPLLSEKEREQLVHTWNATQREYPQQVCVHELFEEQTTRTPDSVAVVFGEDALTYSTLNASANQVARLLQRAEVRSGDPVGICLERSLQMVIGFLGILKAGGTYVPLDPIYPVERLAFMLEDVQAAVVISQPSFSTLFPTYAGQIVYLDARWNADIRASSENLSLVLTDAYPAYILYTSGSAGTPKGVCVTHRAIKRLVCNTDYVRVEPKDRMGQISNSSFDAATFEIWGALLHGACLIVVPKDLILSPQNFALVIVQQALNIFFFTAALFQQMVQEAPSALSSIRHLLVGGEAVDPRGVRALQAKRVPERLLNGYGPTECTTFAVCSLIAQVTEDATTIPIGHPIANTQAYILDAYLNPVPVGVSGELYLGGDGLALGYHRQAALTAERFLPNPFANCPGSRLYRTGDQVRYQPDGNIEFLGRIDRQVKLRGHRIELGEIETALQASSAVREAIVLLQGETAADKRLVAYVVRQPGERLEPRELQSALQRQLPAYMIPSYVVELEKLPLTPNGKVDRRALSVLQEKPGEELNEQQKARTPLEELLVDLWSGVLEHRQIGIHDNFFERGGHSLLATQLLARVRGALAVEIPLQTVFESPTVAAFAQRVEQALGSQAVAMLPPLQPGERPDALPLSFAQQRLWFLEQLEPESIAYLVPSAFFLEGTVQECCLQTALQDLMSRHESLRTTFALQGEQPVQIIHPPMRFQLPVIDLQALKVSQAQEQEQARLLAQQEAEQPCDLEQGPLLRTTLLRLGSTSHVLLLTLHHIITDGWSNEILLQELTMLYQAGVNGQPSPLASLAVQYADYALWQRQWLQGEVLEGQLSYWRTQLAGVPPLELPTDHPRPAVQITRGASLPVYLPASLSKSLVALSRREQVTLFMLLQASFQVVLARWSGQSDISVGTPIANRRLEQTEGLIGFFVNTLVLRSDLSGNPSFVQLLQRVRQVCLGAYAHQDVPFEKLVEELAPQRDLSRSPLFQVMFALQNTSLREIALEEVQMQPVSVESSASKFDLTLALEEMEDGLRGALDYNTDLFAVETMKRLLEHWQTVLASVIQAPETPLSELPLLNREECRCLLVDWNATQVTFPLQGSVSECFEQQVRRTPDAIALVYEEHQLTYMQLHQRAHQLASALAMHSVGPEIRVGVCLHRSLELVVALLAIFKAGGVYVPLNPDIPIERLAWMSADAELKLIVTQQKLASLWPQQQIPLLYLDKQAAFWSQQDRDVAYSELRPDHLAYVIYTSGSTGRPKGAMVEQRGMLNHLNTKIQELRIGAHDRMAQTAPISFDIAIWQMLAALLVGGCTIIYRTEVVYEPSRFLSCLQRDRVSLLELVPSFIQALLQESQGEAWQDGLPALRWLVSTGEALSPLLARRWQTCYPDISLLNAYGPTECSDDVATAVVQQITEGKEWLLPIGRPVGNLRLYVLDAWGGLVPRGSIGEIYVGGIGVGRGYLQDPERTAQTFVPDPFAQEPGQRLYRTGDRGRYRADGQLEYLGRRDQQVKVRGARIELGEIEAALHEQAVVREVVVLLQEGRLTEKRLVAYVVGQSGEQLSDQQLRAALQEQLPTYMIPSVFVQLSALPLTSNGKVDRRALSALQEKPGEELNEQQRARTPLEELLVDLWSEVLGHRQIGIHDNFFEQGGHSLLATQLLARVRGVLAVEVPLRAVFEAPTVAAFAQRVEQALRSQEGAVLPPLQVAVRPSELPLSYAQQRLWFLDQLEPESTAYLLPGAFHLEGIVQECSLEKALQELMNRHESLRTTFEVGREQPVQVVHPPTRFQLPVIDLQALGVSQAQEQARLLVQQEAQQPCDLEQGPLLRTALLRLGPTSHVFLLTLHHIITDGWSNEILLQELTVLYQALVQGLPSPLAPLAIQYADYALWQRQWLQGDVLEEQLVYWRMQLDEVPVLELPTDHPRPAVQSDRGASLPVQLSRQLSEELAALSRREQVTLFMLLLASFQVVLARWSGQSDISVGTPIANRQVAQTEALIGFFVNTLVLRSDLSGNPSFVQLLQRVRQVCLGAYAHQDVSFEKLVEELAPRRDLSRSPLFQVMLALQNTPSREIELAEVQMQPVMADSNTSQFDLALMVYETEEGLQGALRYSTDLFAAETMHRLLDHWQRLLEGVVQASETPLADLPLLSLEERQRLLVDWNATQVIFPQHCLPECFEQQVQRTPEAIALVYEEQQLTYAQLNRRANQLAHYLYTLGVGPDVLVGICLERSLEMVIGIVGVLKAGGAYVPFDPEYPVERSTLILENCHPAVILTQGHLRSHLPLFQGEVVTLDEQWKECISAEPESDPEQYIHLETLAYQIYTSGSTGLPKGVQISHRALMNFLQAMMKTLEIGRQETVVALTSLAFDISGVELYVPLLQGCRLVLGKQGVGSRSDALGELLTVMGASVVQATPSGWRVLLESGWRGGEELLILCTGEAFPQELAPQLLTLGKAVWNMYGPTETTVWSTIYQVTAQDNLISIGRPIANTQIYLLDSAGNPVPVGVFGELYIGGAGLARGYSGRADLTAERFVPNPFAEQEGERLYRTGDFARYRTDGAIEYLGRKDQQVKMRGFRIELGEIESVLRAHSAIGDAVVLLRENVKGAKSLVAYIVITSEMQPTREEMRAWLRQRVPDYMIPASFISLEALPLTPNGKLDRRALSTSSYNLQREEDIVGPRTPLEERVTKIWAEILQTPATQMSVHDNFFDLGGHSLLATQMISHIRQQVQVDVPLLLFFNTPTIAEIAHIIEQKRNEFVEQMTDGEDLEQMIAALESLSDEEVSTLLASKYGDKGKVK